MFNEFTTNHINIEYLDILYTLTWSLSVNLTIFFKKIENNSKWPNTIKKKTFLLKFIKYLTTISFFLIIWTIKEISNKNVNFFLLQLNSLILGILILITLIKFLHIYNECKKNINFEKIIIVKFKMNKNKFYFNWIIIIIFLTFFLITHFLLLFFGKIIII